MGAPRRAFSAWMRPCSWAPFCTLALLRKMPPTPSAGREVTSGSDGLVVPGIPTTSVAAACCSSEAGVQAGVVGVAAGAVDGVSAAEVAGGDAAGRAAAPVPPEAQPSGANPASASTPHARSERVRRRVVTL